MYLTQDKHPPSHVAYDLFVNNLILEGPRNIYSMSPRIEYIYKSIRAITSEEAPKTECKNMLPKLIDQTPEPMLYETLFSSTCL